MRATKPFSNKKRMATWGGQATKLETGLILLMAGGSVFAEASLSPDKVEASLHPNESVVIEKTVTTPALPPKIDVCLLEDETGSFGDDINNLKMAAPDIYDTVIAKSPEARFAVAGFRDYPINPYGSPGDWVYWLRSLMNSDKTAWTDGVNSLTAGGGADMPEAQYDAIVAALNGLDDPTKGLQSPCNFDPNPNVTKVLLVATDAPFHIPTGDGDPHVNDLASTTGALQAANIKVIGLKGPGAESELDALATATGGSVQPVTSDGANIGQAIIAGLQNLPVKVAMTSDCADPILTGFEPSEQEIISGGKILFKETITVANGAMPSPTPVECKDWALINGEPMKDESGNIVYEQKSITVLDGRMTGGGSVFAQDGTRVTHGFELHCASAMQPNNVQINWGKGNRFKLDTLTSAKCSDTPGIGEEKPIAGLDTLKGQGVGQFNGQPGAMVEFEFVDSGEPGFNDSAYFKVMDASGNVVMTAGGALKNGNHQAHRQ